MPIVEVRESEIEQECSNCGAKQVIAVSKLQVGVGRKGQLDSRIVSLSDCQCGAKEYLIRRPDSEQHPAPGSYSHLHGLLVATVHARLVKAGQLAPGLPVDSIESHEPVEELALWFPEGLRLPRPKGESV